MIVGYLTNIVSELCPLIMTGFGLGFMPFS